MYMYSRDAAPKETAVRTVFHSNGHLCIVMCGPGLACKPGLGPGLRRLRLSRMLSPAKAPTQGLAQAWLGLSRGFGRGGRYK